MNKKAYTVNELSKEIGIGRSKIYDLIKDRKLRAKKLGKRTIFLAADVEDLLNNLPTAA